MKAALYQKFGKRMFDIILSLMGLIVLSPILAGLCIALFIKHGQPVFFRQKRPGLNEKPFNMIKFRTMLDTRDGSGNLLSDAERITPIGAFMRRTSLDELPELWNVLIGDMSLVGPRPLLMEYLPKYTDTQRRRHETLPGVTGLAQISGRQAIPFSQRLEKDVWYVDNLSFSKDVSILWSTVIKVLLTRDVIVGQEVDEVDDIGLSADLLKPGQKAKNKS